jgi:hypothetical protein
MTGSGFAIAEPIVFILMLFFVDGGAIGQRHNGADAGGSGAGTPHHPGQWPANDDAG